LEALVVGIPIATQVVSIVKVITALVAVTMVCIRPIGLLIPTLIHIIIPIPIPI